MHINRVHLHSLAALVLATTTLADAARAAESVQFTYRPPLVGQQGSHEMQFQLDLKMTVRQAGQTISADQQQLSRDQERHTTILQVSKNGASKVEVLYTRARETVDRGKSSAASQTQPIEGKSYQVERRGEELIVTDVQGQSVPEEELVLVVASMASVGRPSPLGTFLNGKTATVGQTLKLPNEMAADLLGMKETGGEPQKVELTLRSLRQEANRRIAEFSMLIALKLDGGGTMEIKGDLALDCATCQVTTANFAGPVAMREEHGPKGHTFEVVSDGTMKVAVRSTVDAR